MGAAMADAAADGAAAVAGSDASIGVRVCSCMPLIACSSSSQAEHICSAHSTQRTAATCEEQ